MQNPFKLSVLWSLIKGYDLLAKHRNNGKSGRHSTGLFVFMFRRGLWEPTMHWVTFVCLVLTFMFCTHPAACASSCPSDGNLPGPNNDSVHSLLPSCQPANILLDHHPTPCMCGQVEMHPSLPGLCLWSVKQCGNHNTVQESSPSSRWHLLRLDRAAEFYCCIFNLCKQVKGRWGSWGGG